MPDSDVDRRDRDEAIAAATRGDVAALRRAIERRPAIVAYSPDHRPLIELAVREGHLDAVRLLLDAGADPTPRCRYGETLPQMARDRWHEETASLLDAAIARAPHVNAGGRDGNHAIHAAAEAGHVSLVRSLLDGDPTLLNRGDTWGATPLQRAVIGYSRRVVTLLLDRGADVHAIHPAGTSRHQQMQAIDIAIWGGYHSIRPTVWRLPWLCAKSIARKLVSRGPVQYARVHDPAIVRLLLARGAACDLPIAAALGDRRRVTAILDDNPARIREARPNGQLALSAAVAFGRHDIVRRLLDRGADPTWPDAHDSSRGAALHAAAGAGDYAMVELLLARGADPNGYVNAGGNAVYAARTPEIRALLVAHGGTLDPFDLVFLGDDEAVLRRIREDPASADTGCGGVFTAVCTCQRRELLTRLLDAGGRVSAPAGGCHTYLLEHADMLRTLLSRRALDPDYPTEDGVTLLHELCGPGGGAPSNRIECATLLLDAGAHISATDAEYRSTPLAWAARLNMTPMVEFLLARGAPTQLPDDEPWATPLAWATRRGHTNVIELLRAAGAR